MVLGAMVDAGLPLEALRDALGALDLTGYELEAEQVAQHSVTGTRVTVRLDDASEQPARSWSDIRTMIERSRLGDRPKATSLAIFSSLADAEARVHGTPPDEVHFHEVGAVDSIVDIVGAAIGFDLLGIEQIFSGPVSLGHGFVNTRHGLLPVPAPATAELLALGHAPTLQRDVEAELLTPTGAAILTTLADFSRPTMRTEAVGYGFGRRELPWPNALRLWLGELSDEPDDRDDDWPEELLLETNIDDMNPEFYEPLIERLFEAGALDVFLTPIIMKRGRPATKLSVICASRIRGEIDDLLIEHSSTLGVRTLPIDRTKAGRRIERVVTRWGDVRVKLKIWRGRVLDAVPEYADCLAITRETGMPIRHVYGEVSRIAEAYVGRRVEDAE
jgi:uncharacterized protein (TIGR00299 family) protein